MPASLKMATLRARQKADGYDFARTAPGTFHSKIGRNNTISRVTSTTQGVRITHDTHFAVEIETTQVGREPPSAHAVKRIRAEGQDLVLTHNDNVEERYQAGPLGLEQSYVVKEKPTGSGPLTIHVAFTGLLPEPMAGRTDRVLLKDPNGNVRGGYRDLAVADANGHDIVARMEVRNTTVALVIDDTGARYPLQIDPLVWLQQAKLTASGDTSDDRFGSSVMIDGNTAIIGVPYDDEKGTGSGSAYVFTRTGTAWTQQAKLLATDGTANSQFGTSVSVSGDTAVIGAVGDNDQGTSSGSAYVFTRTGSTWAQQAKLTANDSMDFDGFGNSVVIDGNTALIGASLDDDNTKIDSGSAYVFTRTGSTWSQQAKLFASDNMPEDLFGNSVALSKDTAIIGAPYNGSNKGNGVGSAYVFVRTGSTWIQQAKLVASNGAAHDFFGWSVSLSGDTSLIGVFNNDEIGKEPGSAYVFTHTGSTWSQQAKLFASDDTASSQFGTSVSISNNTALIGASSGNGNDNNSGVAYIFTRTGTTWAQQEKLAADDSLEYDYFGISVALSDDTALIGAMLNNNGKNNLGPGAAYVFTRKRENGNSCQSASECDSNFCVDNVCCNTACDAGACDACSKAAGAATDGTCALLTGNTCDDGNACTKNDTCNSGICGGSFYSCTSTDCQASSTCNGLGGCTIVNKPQGTACIDDGNLCTGDICNGSGVCEHKNKANGTTCGAGLVCYSGSCGKECFINGQFYAASTKNPNNPCEICNPAQSTTAFSPRANGTICNDDNACTKVDTCQKGKCIGSDPVVCTALDTCHEAGICDPATGLCSNPDAPDGTVCDDGDACTQTDICQVGTCMGGNPKSCVALDECHDIGTCDSETGACTNPSKADGETCSIGICESGQCEAGGMGGQGGDAGASGEAGEGGSTTAGAGGNAGVGNAGGNAGASGSTTAGAGGKGKQGGATLPDIWRDSDAQAGTSGNHGDGNRGGESMKPLPPERPAAPPLNSFQQESSEDGSCGCRTTRATSSPSSLLWLAGLGLLASRRSRRS